MNSLVFSNMLHRPARTAVSIIGIGVGILLIIATVGLANGSLREQAKREANVGAEIMFRASGTSGFSGSDALRIPIEMEADLEKIEGVAAAVPIGQTNITAADGITGSRLLDGVIWDKYAAMAGLRIMQGRKFVDGRDELMADTAWLDGKKLKVGDKLSVYDREFDIVGSYEPSAGARIKTSLAALQTQLGSEGKTSAFLVTVKDGYTAEAVGNNLHAKFPDNQIILTSQLEELFMQGIPALNVFLNVVIGVAGAISALIILLTMYTTVTERTRQIGVMKSLGMSKTGIAWTIVQEALAISFGGIVFGVLATVLLKYAFAKWTTLTLALDPQVIVTIVVVGLISSMIGALYPGLRAARLDAVEALNYD